MGEGSLNEGVRRREVFGWAMYDFANSGYTTVVLTAVFNAYFVGVVAQGAAWGTLAWTATLGVSSLLVMVLMPGLGAWADARGAKKRLLGLATAGCVAATALLAWAAYLGHALAPLGVALFVAWMNRFQISPEESALTALFGDEFARYCRAVRRWL
jgi:UMF1 family MFS transporter